MDTGTQYITPDIKLTCYTERQYNTEVMFEQHLLAWCISGGARIICPEGEYTFGAGDIFLIPRHHLATAILYAKEDGPHRSVSMRLTTDRLRAFYAELDVVRSSAPSQRIHQLHDHPLVRSCLASLVPYFDMTGPFPERIAALKITEAITILRTVDPGMDVILSNLEPPGKIDLAAFMERNFMFNMPLEKFGYLTGRSLTTFKRDFKQAYRTTPQRWLTQKRLELAHRRLVQQQRPSDVYYETGFENLSHFSYAFKKHYGYAPSELVERS